MKKCITLIAFCALFATAVSAQNTLEESKSYGKNLISVSPFVGYATPEVSDLGIGIGYEHFLNDYISAKLPFNYGLSTNMISTGIGLKFYPGGHNRPVKYAVAPTLMFTRSTPIDYITELDSVNNIWFTREVENPLTQVGFILNSSLNITIQRNIYIGAEMGLGINYLNNYKNDYSNQNWNTPRSESANVLFQFTLAMGYRF